MKISELKIGEKADIEAEVTEIGEVRTFVRFGRPLKVATATLKDDSGEIKMSLWNEDADRVKVGNKVKLTDGFVKEFQGEKQITTGKLGKLEILGEGEGAGAEAPAEAGAPAGTEAEAQPEEKPAEEEIEEKVE